MCTLGFQLIKAVLTKKIVLDPRPHLGVIPAYLVLMLGGWQGKVWVKKNN